MDNNRQENVQTAAIPLSGPDGAGEGSGFIAYANSRVEKLRDEGRYDAANKLKMYLRRFIAYLGKNEVPFKDFDALLMRNYHTWLFESILIEMRLEHPRVEASDADRTSENKSSDASFSLPLSAVIPFGSLGIETRPFSK